MKDYIFSLGIIPVQEFISEARRSRDLRAGSAILSWLMSRVLCRLTQDSKTQLIIPHPDSLKEFCKKELKFPHILEEVKYSLPNRASGYCGDEVLEIFDSLQQECLQAEWEKLYKDALGKKELDQIKMDEISRNAIRDSFKRTSQCPIQLLYVVKEVPNRTDKPSHLKEINDRYSNIKRTRPIQIWPGGKEIGKCDQCGKREMFSSSDKFQDWWEWQKKLKSEEWIKEGRRIDAGERLCIVCLMKRFAAYLDRSGKSFPSTSEVASRYWHAEVAHLPEFKTYKKIRERAKFEDPEILYYKRSIRKKLNAKETPEWLKNALNKILAEKGKLAKAIEESSVKVKPEPSNYLAVLMFDGDNMGKKIQEYVDSLPKSLHEFSKAVRETFQSQNSQYFAEIFYIGGDEGLILTPLETALETALEIKRLFAEHIQETTLSMGIAIFDRERPLGGAIQLARQALEQAKEIDKKKNALTVTIQTASANIFSTTAKWDKSWERVQNAIQLINGEFEDRKLSMGWAYEVEAFLESLPNPLPDRWGEQAFRQAVKDEVKRITLRKLQILRGTSQEKKSQKKDIWDNGLHASQWFDSAAARGVEPFSNQLHVIAFLCRESAYRTEYLSEQIEEREEL